MDSNGEAEPYRSGDEIEMKVPRPLSADERQLVHWMIVHSEVAPEKYLRQLESAIVVRECQCGCASIDFQIGETKPNIKAGMKVISDYLYGPEELPFAAFVFTCDDTLAGLEVYSFADTPAPLPKPEDLRSFDKGKPEPSDAPRPIAGQ